MAPASRGSIAAGGSVDEPRDAVAALARWAASAISALRRAADDRASETAAAAAALAEAATTAVAAASRAAE